MKTLVITLTGKNNSEFIDLLQEIIPELRAEKKSGSFDGYKCTYEFNITETAKE